MAAAKRAAVGQKNPMDRMLKGVASSYASELHRAAVGAVLGKKHACLTVGLGPAAGGSSESVAEGTSGVRHLGRVAAAQIGAAGFPRGFDLLGSADVGLREFYFFLRARHLTLVPLG